MTITVQHQKIENKKQQKKNKSTEKKSKTGSYHNYLDNYESEKIKELEDAVVSLTNKITQNAHVKQPVIKQKVLVKHDFSKD